MYLSKQYLNTDVLSRLYIIIFFYLIEKKNNRKATVNLRTLNQVKRKEKMKI